MDCLLQERRGSLDRPFARLRYRVDRLLILLLTQFVVDKGGAPKISDRSKRLAPRVIEVIKPLFYIDLLDRF